MALLNFECLIARSAPDVMDWKFAMHFSIVIWIYAWRGIETFKEEISKFYLNLHLKRIRFTFRTRLKCLSTRSKISLSKNRHSEVQFHTSYYRPRPPITHLQMKTSHHWRTKNFTANNGKWGTHLRQRHRRKARDNARHRGVTIPTKSPWFISEAGPELKLQVADLRYLNMDMSMHMHRATDWMTHRYICMCVSRENAPSPRSGRAPVLSRLTVSYKVFFIRDVF